MLEYRKVNDDILEVKETTMSFIKTFVRYSYYNIKTWYKSNVLKESTGKGKRMFDEMDMTVLSIEYILSQMDPNYDYSQFGILQRPFIDKFDFSTLNNYTILRDMFP